MAYFVIFVARNAVASIVLQPVSCADTGQYKDLWKV